MDHQKLNFPLVVLSTALFIQLAAGAEPFFHVCTDDKKYISNSEYDKNLRILLRDLYDKTPETGYQYESVIGRNNDTVYGSALCRGDVSQVDCSACVSEATKGIGQLCPNNVGANIWYEHCSLEYSNSNSFGNPITTEFYLKGKYKASIPAPHSSLAKIKKLFNLLSDEASASKTCLLKEFQSLMIWYWISMDSFRATWILLLPIAALALVDRSKIFFLSLMGKEVKFLVQHST